MTFGEISAIIEAEAVGQVVASRVVLSSCACDRLSDVLLQCATGQKAVLLTNLTNIQTIRVAAMLDAVGICFMQSKRPKSASTLALAREEDIGLLSSPLSLEEAFKRLCDCGLCGCGSEESQHP